MSGVLLDARSMKLIRRMVIPPKFRAQSIYWHEIDSRPCLCETLHNHCWAVRCLCGRHEGEIGS